MKEFRNSGKIVGDIIAPAAEESEWEVLGRQGSIRLP
jgi:hypothetical protein